MEGIKRLLISVVTVGLGFLTLGWLFGQLVSVLKHIIWGGW